VWAGPSLPVFGKVEQRKRIAGQFPPAEGE
jgi:hypothetical protein